MTAALLDVPTRGTASLARLAAPYLREVGAARVGDFYEQHRELLSRPATDANIAEFARLETDYFRRQPSLVARGLSELLSEDRRAGLIRYSAERQRAAP